ASMFQAYLRAEQQPMRFGQAVDRFGREIFTLERDDVNAPRPRGMTIDQHVWWHVVQHAAHAGHEAVRTDRRVMVYAHAARDRGVIMNVNVASQQRAVGHDDVIANTAVVGDVRTGHEEVVVTDRGDAVFLLGGAVDRDAFADNVRIADRYLRLA